MKHKLPIKYKLLLYKFNILNMFINIQIKYMIMLIKTYNKFINKYYAKLYNYTEINNLHYLIKQRIKINNSVHELYDKLLDIE